MELEHQLQIILNKLQQALKQEDVLQKENQQLKEEKEKLIKELFTKNQQIEELERSVEVGVLNMPGWRPDEKKLLETRIDNYLREIEKCLALLNA